MAIEGSAGILMFDDGQAHSPRCELAPKKLGAFQSCIESYAFTISKIELIQIYLIRIITEGIEILHFYKNALAWLYIYSFMLEQYATQVFE
jgi:hypothetical protein